MAKICDNTSVGMIIKNGDDMAIIFRKNYPEAYALPAGHVDGDNPWNVGLKREVREEVGLDVTQDKVVFKKDIDNPCKRENGSHHSWEVSEAISWTGELKAGYDAKEARWRNLEKVKELARRTEYFINKYAIPYDAVGELTVAIFGINPGEKKTDPEWKENPGLEPVWYYILKELKYI
ncbi:MAG: NUDIX hydrolase [bacterium]|nr:NUDIX hydrolase [bacterium]